MSEEDRDQPEGPPAAQLAEVFSDTPLRGAAGLAFEFEGLARTLAELAWNPRNRTPFTVVVRGQWGRGKTTLMRQAQRLLQERLDADGERATAGLREVHAVWFNAWKYPSEETVLAGLLGAVLDAMATGGLRDQLEELFKRHKGQLPGQLLNAAAAWLKVDLKLDETPLSRAEEKRAFYDVFERLFAEVLSTWQERKLPEELGGRDVDVSEKLEETSERHVLAIFLDDLDRCKEKRVVEVLEAINLFLDLPGVCFYLGLDWQRLTELLARQMPGREDEFLEKIVQVSLDLPAVNKQDIRDYMEGLVAESALASVLGAHDADGAGDLTTFAEALEHDHPRHVKRVLNDLAMTLGVMRNTKKLGPSHDQVPERAVVAWHILHEVCSDEEWREIRSLRANLDGFLVRWNAAAAADEGTEDEVAGERSERAGLSDRMAQLQRAGTLDGPMAVLSSLSPGQRDLLVHLGSPPKEERASVFSAQTSGVSRLGRLQDLESHAWVSLPGGSFSMGSDEEPDERPIHTVTVSAYLISRHPVTNAQFAEYVHSVPSAAVPGHWADGQIPEGKDNHPVVLVSWNDAQAFCTWLSSDVLGEQENGNAVRLPTEAEWEFAARGPEGRRFPWGSEEPTGERANFDELNGDTTAVDRYVEGSTQDGVFDLGGNVLEWCSDWYEIYPDSGGDQRDPPGPSGGQSRVTRGGSFNISAAGLRGASRYSPLPVLRREWLGFRVAWSLAGGQD